MDWISVTTYSLPSYTIRRQQLNSGSGNGFLPDGIKPLPEPMLTKHQQGSVVFSWEHFHGECSILYYEFENYTFKVITTSPRDQ